MTAVAQTSHHLEDALAYLSRKAGVEYRRGQVIYDEHHPSNGLSLIIQGRVKLTTTTEDGSQDVTDIVSADEFFGASALLGKHATPREQATAMEITTLMTWPTAEIETQIERQPKLGLALIQILVARCLDFGERMQSLALDKTPKRVATGLLHFARLGTRESDGAVCIPPLTHQLLAEYLGTSREIVTFQMNRLRSHGFVRYSRKAIQIYPEALTEYLRG